MTSLAVREPPALSLSMPTLVVLGGVLPTASRVFFTASFLRSAATSLSATRGVVSMAASCFLVLVPSSLSTAFCMAAVGVSPLRSYAPLRSITSSIRASS